MAKTIKMLSMCPPSVAKTADLADAAEEIKEYSFLFDREANVLYIKVGKSLMKVTETADTEKMKNDIGIINNKLAFGYEQDKRLNEYIRQNAELISELTSAIQRNEAMDSVEATKLNNAKEAWVKVASELQQAVTKNTMQATANADDINHNTFNDKMEIIEKDKSKKWTVVKNILLVVAIVVIAVKAFLF